MMIPSISRLTAINMRNNASFGMISASNSLMQFCSASGMQNQNPANLLANEQRLTQSMLNNSLLYKIASVQEESMKKLSDENIKRSFSTFA